MTASLKRRVPVVAAALLLVLGLAAALVASSTRGATAQPARVLWSVQFQDFVPLSNGHGEFAFNLDALGPNGVMLTAMCTGNRPRTGPSIPAQVVTNVTSIDGFSLRVLNNVGRPLNAPDGVIGVNCLFLAETDEVVQPTVTSLTNKITGAKVTVRGTKA